ncbi:MAG: DUF1801 domain-containing protein [Anaerolineae bacterium]
MQNDQPAPQTIDEYIAAFPDHVQQILQQIRQTIHEAAPDAQEAISYQMPTFKLHGRSVVHFGAFKKHIGFYPAPVGLEAFKDELAPYASSKGAVQFPLNQPIPFDLISKITAFRVQQNLQEAEAKRNQRRSRY